MGERSTFISLLRGINVSGQNKLAMDELRNLYERLNLANVTSYVQSGNLVFESEERDSSRLARKIESQIEQTFGYSIPVIIRMADELHRILTTNPFLKGKNVDSTKLHVTFLHGSPPMMKLNKLKNPDKEGDEFSIGEGEIFLFCPNGYGRTKLSNAYFERKLNVSATTRNWKTVNALYKMALERP
jgi:uncharacterized protein (DUF1697 family)